MQSMERLILQTWDQLKPQLLSNPQALARRLKRRNGRSFSQPRRAWCLAVRACDRRIGVTNGLVDPEYATDPHDPEHPGRVVEHRVTLNAPLLHELCCPVRLTPGGELRDAAAKKLGTTPSGLNSARISGALKTRHVRGLIGRHGAIPIISAPHLLDPSAGRDFAIAHPLWIGTEYVSARIPNDLSQTVTRVPIYRSTISRHQYADDVHPELTGAPPRQRKRLPPPVPDYVWYKWSKAGQFLGEDPRYWRKHPSDPGSPPPPQPKKRKRQHHAKPSRAGGSLTFSGWRWLCPQCNRRVRTLYLPAPPAALIDWPESPKQIPNPTGEKSSSLGTSFACSSCHHLRYFSSIAPDGWNDLVSTLSGGLLRGKDIPKPAWFRETAHRRIAYRPRLREAPRRERLLKLILEGLTTKQIAETMHLHFNDVGSRIAQLCKQENVPTRAALAKKHGQDPTLQPDRRGKASQRRDRVLELLLSGWTSPQIAKKLGMKWKTTENDIYKLCLKHGAKGRNELIGKHGVPPQKFVKLASKPSPTASLPR